MATPVKEGNLQAPTRHPLDWKNQDFYNADSLFREMERVFDICHGCRRCVSLCQSFPTLFDLVDNSATLEVDGILKAHYWQVVDHCYLCDLCFMTKCPYVPPHSWNLDFPHLMLRAKAFKFKEGSVKRRDRILTSTVEVGNLAGIPVISTIINKANKMAPLRRLLEKTLEIHAEARLPEFHSNTLQMRLKGHRSHLVPQPTGKTKGKMALFATCYMNRNEPGPGEDLVAVFEHNGIPVSLAHELKCCGMPKLELGDLETVDQAKSVNIPLLADLVDQGYDLTALVPSCVLMFKQELPLMYPSDPEVQKVKKAFYDPFEYLMLRHKEGRLKTEFAQSLGKVSYQASCHQRVQNIGQKTREILALVPDTQVEIIERCSGHDGTYAVKKECHEFSMKIVEPVAERIRQFKPDHYGSDCAMAGHHIENALNNGQAAEHPISLLRWAYGV
ncbi:MAG: heterodisulfide reductase-related iron-sulfur binding cluster [Pseudomonadota bacterium]